MIQTRGRARKAGSHYIILADQGQMAFQEKLKNQEKLLDFVIGAAAHGPSCQAEQIFQSLEGDTELNVAKAERRERVLNSGTDDVGFFVFVQV